VSEATWARSLCPNAFPKTTTASPGGPGRDLPREGHARAEEDDRPRGGDRDRRGGRGDDGDAPPVLLDVRVLVADLPGRGKRVREALPVRKRRGEEGPVRRLNLVARGVGVRPGDGVSDLDGDVPRNEAVLRDRHVHGRRVGRCRHAERESGYEPDEEPAHDHPLDAAGTGNLAPRFRRRGAAAPGTG
jgi:hypothetical protein